MNIKEVAKLARVSTATVSRTINGSDKVTPKTAERVRRAIESLDYYPNHNARALGSGRSRIYGLIISDITNPFFPDLVKGFEDVAVKHGMEVIVANTGYSSDRMKICVQRMLERKVDGVAIMTSEMDKHLIQEFSKRGIPLVFLDTGTPGAGVSNISIDYSEGIHQAVEHLVELNHKHIGFIAGPMELASARTRKNAFLKAMQQSGMRVNPKLIQEGNHKIEGGYAAMERLIEMSDKVTAVLSSNDLTAIGAIRALQHHHLQIPEDISIVGFDDIEISTYLHPALTTVKLSRIEIATHAFNALHAANQRLDKQGSSYAIQPQLVVRESTGPAQKSVSRRRA
ncbi:MAG: LacI family DNA-binding transcriptional regulator [Acidobacteriaceae bacterium]